MEATLNFGPIITKNYRVPAELREIKHNAYTPRMFLIGPLHLDKLELQIMEKEKRRYMSCFLDRVEEQAKEKFVNNGDESTENSSQTLALDMCHKVVTELEKEAREWYAEDIHLDKQQLVERLLLDGCFILELFYKWNPINLQKNKDQSLPIDPLSGNLAIVKTLRNDLMLLENQIPFVVLQKLFDLIPKNASIGYPEPSLREYVLLFFNSIPMLQYNISNFKDDTYRHLLDMLYHICDDTLKRVCDGTSKITPGLISSNDWGFSRCATDLYKSGFQFVSDHSRAIVDINFNEGEISIPQVIIDKSIDTLLRNLIALEQTNSGGHSVTSYVKVMSSLIRSPEDADLLEHLGIIITNSEVEMNASVFFESLCRKVVFVDFCFADLCKKVDNYHIPVWRLRRLKGYFRIQYVEWKKTIMDLKQDYFRRSLKYIVTSSFILLGFLQTFYTIRGYYHPPYH